MYLQLDEIIGILIYCMQDTFARATHSAGRPSAARDDRVSCIQTDIMKLLNVPSQRFSRLL